MTRITPSCNRRTSRTPVLALVIAAFAGTFALSQAPGALSRDDQQSDVQAINFGRSAAPSLYWGAWIGKQFNGTEPPWDMSAVQQFEAMVGKGLSLVEWAQPFAACEDSSCPRYGFPTTPMQNVRDYGAIPFLSWASDANEGVNQPDHQLSDLLNGSHDALIRDFAIGAKDWGHPFFLRFNWEMNGDWFPWSELTNGNRPGEYVAAWRRVHDIFTAVGATNATWVWCPYVDLGAGLTYDSLYPGDAYVDWTCLDGYNWGSGPARSAPWRSFDKIFRVNYRMLTRDIAPTKPVILGEVASSDYGGVKVTWLRNMFRGLAKLPSAYPKVHGFIWFDVDDRSSGWPIENSPAQIKAFRAGLGSDAFVPNRFGQIGGGKIQPLPSRQTDFNEDAGD